MPDPLLHFYPRPPRGGRRGHPDASGADREFLSTPSARRATSCFCPLSTSRRNFYPRPPRGGRPCRLILWTAPAQSFLSTPSARRATRQRPGTPPSTGISIHALREEGDASLTLKAQIEKIFLSTPSARRATYQTLRRKTKNEDFYPRPPRGGRLDGSRKTLKIYTISIHALREEGDSSTTWEYQPKRPFLSTPSARRATRHNHSYQQGLENFYPRPPRGGRLDCINNRGGGVGFLSTPSARRATVRR